jgi:hypothetical protein
MSTIGFTHDTEQEEYENLRNYAAAKDYLYHSTAVNRGDEK